MQKLFELEFMFAISNLFHSRATLYSDFIIDSNLHCIVTHRRRILQRSFNFRLAQKDVSTACTPQHAFERRDALPQDDSRDEAIRVTTQSIILINRQQQSENGYLGCLSTGMCAG